jgi:FdhE protein
MPYAVLPPVDREARLALAELRWCAMLASRPDLRAAVALQRTLIGLVIDLAAAFDVRGVTKLSLPPRYLTIKLAAGIPALSGEPIQAPADVLRPTLVHLCRALADGGGGEAALQMRAAIEADRIDAGALLTLALRREQAALRVAATRAGLGHDLLWLVADLAVAPYAHALLDTLFGAPAPGSPLGNSLDAWTRGYCPLCGSWPAVIESAGDHRLLRCGLCAAAWETMTNACVYCGNGGDGFAAITPDPDQPTRRAETCTACHGYTKVVEADAPLPFPLLALADLESMDLDLVAIRQGFARPALRQFSTRR